MFTNIRPMEWLFILAVVLIIFGPSQLPKLARMLGEGIRTLKKSLAGEEAAASDAPKPPESKDGKA